MRNMYFSATTQQIIDRTKTVTRRLGWEDLEPGELIQAIEKGQGLKKGEHVRKLAVLRIVSNRRECLYDMTNADCAREGFPEMNSGNFCRMFAKLNRCQYEQMVNRIEFEYVEESP
jgi:hypothetical protein